MPGLVRALENAAVQAGVTIRTDCTVKSVQIGVTKMVSDATESSSKVANCF